MPKIDSIEGMNSKIELSAEIARIALDCPSCKKHVREVIQRYRDQTIQNNNVISHQGGGRSSLQAMNESKDGLTNVYYTSKYK
jgi:bacterioferritin-associated ferredoxin